MLKNIKLSLILILSLFLLANGYATTNSESVFVARFSMMDMDGWKNKSFEGETQYSMKNGQTKSYLQAESVKSASALYKKVKIDIDNNPYMNWSWRIDQALPELKEMDKSGDDYAARIYVVVKTGYTPLSAKALNYVWSSNNRIGNHWPNAHTDKAIMIPLRCNLDANGIWNFEKVNIKEDLMKYFGIAPKFIDGVAIMTDTDNSKGNASALSLIHI